MNGYGRTVHRQGNSMENGKVISILKEGYWEQTVVVQDDDGRSTRVRKSYRGVPAEERPWARRSLVEEIRYLKELRDPARDVFPALIRAWGDDQDDGKAGYEMEHLPNHIDLSSLVQAGRVSPEDGEALEAALAEVVFGCIHQTRTPSTSIASHLTHAVELVFADLRERAGFRPLVDGDSVKLDGQRTPSLERCFRSICERGLPDALDASPQVRLHGDLILENVLALDSSHVDPASLRLIDPVSVAGVSEGPPLFDLVKYQSYARGELFAIRNGLLIGRQDDGEPDSYRLEADNASSRPGPFAKAGFGRNFLTAYSAQYGKPDPRLELLLSGYFSLVMAINTTGTQPLTRALAAARDWSAIA